MITREIIRFFKFLKDMCLYTDGVKKVATEDIVCYKMLENRDGKLITPYQHFEVDINKPLRAEGKEMIDIHTSLWCEGFKINGGFIHTYSWKPDAISAQQGRTVYKCVIPKGTTYYFGSHFRHNSPIQMGYASKEIRFLSKITN